MFGRQQRTFSRTTVVDAPVRQVWDLVSDWKAMYWVVTGCVLAVPVPGRPEGVGAVSCSWQRFSDGALRAGVFEVVEFEPEHVVTVLERQRPAADSRVQFRLEAAGPQTKVQIMLAESMYRYEWGMRGIGVNEQYLSRLAEGLELALVNEVPGPHEIETLVMQPDIPAAAAVHEIQIDAAPDVVWRLASDEDGSLLGHPALEKQWLTQHEGRELEVQLVRVADEGMTCYFQQELRPEPFRVIKRGAALETDQRLLAVGSTSLLRIHYRWNPSALTSEAIADSAQRWLGAVKAAAEGAGRTAS